MILCMFVAYVAVYSERSHLGVTLVSMLNSTFVVHHQHRHRPHHQQLNLTRRRADCKAFPRRDNDVCITYGVLVQTLDRPLNSIQ